MFLVLSATTELRDFFARARNGSVRLIKVVIEDGKPHFLSALIHTVPAL